MGIKEHADMVLMGGNVITIDPTRPRAEGVAIKNNKFLCVGTDEQVREMIGEGTTVRNLEGMTIVPGFIESHNHTLIFGLNLGGVDLSRARSITEIISLLMERVRHQEEGTWVVGTGYNQQELKEKRHPTRWDLDRVASPHPILIKHTSAHARVVNSRALALAGITRNTPSPEGGRIMKDEKTGEPTGVLFQFAAMNLVDRLLPNLSVEDLVEALGKANHILLSQGITSAVDAGTNMVDIPTYLLGFRKAVEQGILRIRHTLAIRSDVLIDFHKLSEELTQLEEKLNALNIHPGLGDETLRIGLFKCIPDGAISTATAATYEPYGLDPDQQGTGELMIHPEALAEIASNAHRIGFQLMIHAIGDRAIDATIQAIERALQETPRKDPRPRIEHCVMANAQAIQKMGSLGIIAVVQPAFLWGLGDNWMSQLGAKRAQKMMPMRTFIENKIRMAFSSDRPVVNGAPLLGIHTAVNQKTMNGNDFAPEQKISPEEALRCYTLHGAYGTSEDHIKGSIEVGKLADLVILAEDLTVVSPQRIKDIEVVATMIGGQFVHGRWS